MEEPIGIMEACIVGGLNFFVAFFSYFPDLDCNTEHPGIARSALEGAASSPSVKRRAGQPPYQGTLNERMFEMLKTTRAEEPEDNPKECTTQ